LSGPHDPYRLPPSGRPQQYGEGLRYGDPAPAGYPTTPGPRPRSAGHAEPQPYHKLLLTPTYSWWRPLLGLVLAAGTFVVLLVVVVNAMAVVDSILTGRSVEESLNRDMDPLLLLATNLSLASFIPAAVLAIMVAHRMRPGWLSSVVGRLRWGLLVRMTGLALVVVVCFTFLGGFIPGDGEGPAVDEIQVVSLSTWLAFAVVIVLTTPLQAAAEEYAFRGYAFQALGAWFRTPWVGAILTSVAFAFAHGTHQNLPLFIDRFAFGLVACWLVVRTGGLEAAIALHVMNNVVIFLLTAAVDEVGDALMVSEIPWTAVAVDVGQMVAFALLADRYVRRRGHRTRSLA
jgi:uncharacterized protein